MDPLIRKVNGDNEIEGLNIGINGDYIDKVCGYADDIVFIIITLYFIGHPPYSHEKAHIWSEYTRL